MENLLELLFKICSTLIWLLLSIVVMGGIWTMKLTKIG